MANQTITFDPESGVAYGANLTINGGANFKSTFEVKRPNGTAFNFTGYSGSSQMAKSVAVGATLGAQATFSIDTTVCQSIGGNSPLNTGSKIIS